MQRLVRFIYRVIMLMGGLAVLASCNNTIATPIVVQDLSSANTQTMAALPTRTPTGPTLTVTPTGTPYARPTDDPSLDLNTVLVEVGNEQITLGQYLARVRFERFRALNGARVLIESVGANKIDFNSTNRDQVTDNLAAIFSTLADSEGFGKSIYEIMIHESIIRQEFAARKLTVKPEDAQGYWMREFQLQSDPDRASKIDGLLDKYITIAQRYSNISRDDLLKIGTTVVMGTTLRPIIGETNMDEPVTYRVRRIIAKSATDAQAAYEAIKGGMDFHTATCKYSTDKAAIGNGGSLGYIDRNTIPGLQDLDKLFNAESGTLVGPLTSPLGYHLFKVNHKRTNADGDAQVDVQMLLVNSESLANDLLKRLQAGEDFAVLACQYSLDNTGGNKGEYGLLSPKVLPKVVVLKLNAAKNPGLLEPIIDEATHSYEVIDFVERKLNIIAPDKLEQAINAAFVKWQDDKAASNFVTVRSDIWLKHIPTDPLPRDVSPIMREENFGLPTPAPTRTHTPTPGPTTTPTVEAIATS